MTAKSITLKRLYKSIPIRMACELHQRLLFGKCDKETREMLHEAMRRAGFVRRAAA